MNKKILLLLIIIITVFFAFIAFYRANFTYNDLIIDSKKWEEIVSSRTLSEVINVSNLKFNDYEMFYDAESKTYYYSLIENSKYRFNPIIKIPLKDNVNLAFNKKITEELIESNDTIELLVYNDKEYNIYNIKCTTLPLLNINYDELAGIPKDIDVGMNMYLFDNREDGSNRITKSDGKIHIRGGTTADYQKKGFKLSLTMSSIGNNVRKNMVSLLGMRQDDDWVLYAGYNDQEKIRNVFASNLWYESCANNNMFGIINGNEYRYIELFFNNKYYGLYALGTPVDEKQLALDEEHEYFFKKKKWTESEVTVLTENPEQLEGYALINEEKQDGNAWNALKQYYYTLQTSTDIEELYEISDINNVIDLYLFNTFFQARDNPIGMRLKNAYITIKNYNDKHIVLYTPWDLDLTFGNLYVKANKNYVVQYGLPVDEISTFNLNAINYLKNNGDKEIDSKIRKRYKELRDTYWSDKHIEEVLSSYEDNIYNSGAFSRDKARWTDGTYNDEKDKLSNFKKYVLERLKYVDSWVETMK